MRHEDKRHKGRNLTAFLAVVLILTCVTLIWSGWHTYHFYDDSKRETERQIRVAGLRGTIMHLDEVLTMSARMAAATGDLRWERRYRRFEPQLDAAINKAIALAPGAYGGEAASKTDAANIALVGMENRAFDLVREGSTGVAKAILFSDGYVEQKRIYAQGITRFAEHLEPHLRLGDLRSTIMHLDEVLTMSVRMAAATGDLQWEQRYRQFEPQLDAAINEAIALAPGAYGGEAATKTHAANIALVEMENHAFDLVREGRTDEAKALLFSDEYETQKRIYARGMHEFAGAISSVISAKWKHEQRRILFHALPVLLLLPFLIVAWLVVFRAVGKWRAMLMTNNQRLARQSEELVDLNRTLDRRVLERTTELSKINETLKTEITERKRAEGKYKNVNKQLNAIIKSEPECVKTVANDGSLLSMNPAGLAMVEAESFDEVDGACVYDLVAPEHRENYIELNKRIFEGESAELEFEIIGLKGGRKWMETHSTPLYDDLGDIFAHHSVTRDITERKQAEEELQKLSRAVQASSSAIIITDRDGNIEYVNPKFTDVTGYEREDILGENPRILKSGETPDTIYADMWKTILSGGEWKGEFHNRKMDGSLYWARNSISCVKDANGEITHFISIQDDMTHEYELTEQLNYQASHDALTGLVNRREFERRAERLLSTIQHDMDEHALCFMDLDQFKVVNDTCGHTAGDELLRQLGSVLQSAVRHRDTLARLGGDEFAVLMEHCSLDHAHRVATSLQKVIQDVQFAWEEHAFRVGVSIGLVAITKAIPNLSELMKQADAACYMAKDLGRNRIHVYHPEDTELAQRHGEMQWVARIYRALKEERFCLFAQAIVPLDSRHDTHYELLLRMKDEQGKLIPPGAYLPAAERYNLIVQLDFWASEKAFTLLAAHPAFVKQIHFISINLSGQSLADETFLHFVIKQIQDTGIKGEKVCFEITETAAIANLGAAINFISTLKGLGCRFALDDFGSGLSSFGYLKNLPVDYLKIDGMFVRGIVDDPIDYSMVKSINEIGQVMGMQTIAEFVENDEIKGMLREIGVNYAQGYGIGKPLAFDELVGRVSSVTDIQDPKGDESES